MQYVFIVFKGRFHVNRNYYMRKFESSQFNRTEFETNVCINAIMNVREASIVFKPGFLLRTCSTFLFIIFTPTSPEVSSELFTVSLTILRLPTTYKFWEIKIIVLYWRICKLNYFSMKCAFNSNFSHIFYWNGIYTKF